MRQIDFAPLYRSTVGFDRLVQMLDSFVGPDGVVDGAAFPPYNIEKLSDTEYRITMAIAGFTEAELKIETRDQTLTVRGEKAGEAKEREFLHRGIAGRSFERRFQLADHVEVAGANLANGLLHIELKRNVPERLKPRSITIGTAKDTTPKQLTATAV
jgi:molecular chaperone IbpA